MGKPKNTVPKNPEDPKVIRIREKYKHASEIYRQKSRIRQEEEKQKLCGLENENKKLNEKVALRYKLKLILSDYCDQLKKSVQEKGTLIISTEIVASPIENTHVFESNIATTSYNCVENYPFSQQQQHTDESAFIDAYNFYSLNLMDEIDVTDVEQFEQDLHIKPVKSLINENSYANLSDVGDLMNFFGSSFEEFTEIALF